MIITREIFDKVEENTKLDSDKKDLIEGYAEQMLEYLKQKDVNFSGNSLMVFVNHLLAMMQRGFHGESTVEMEASVLAEIEFESMELAKDASDIFAKKENITLGTSEIALMAIHIQMAKMG